MARQKTQAIDLDTVYRNVDQWRRWENPNWTWKDTINDLREFDDPCELYRYYMQLQQHYGARA